MSDEPAEDLYELRTTSTVRRALGEVLPEAVAAAAYEFITGPLLREPYRVGKRLLPPMDDRFSARRGTYRIIYRIDDKNRIVTVVDVDHRRDVYRTVESRFSRCRILLSTSIKGQRGAAGRLRIAPHDHPVRRKDADSAAARNSTCQ